jgi:hypothetical protein
LQLPCVTIIPMVWENTINPNHQIGGLSLKIILNEVKADF